MLPAVLKVVCLFLGVAAALAQSTATTPPTLTVSTAIPTATAPAGATLPSQVALPPKQAWCPSEIFCAGSLLQTVNLAHLFPDDKTFADKPTNKPSQQVLADFQKISSSNVTFDQIVSFVEQDFSGEGLELEALALPNFNPNPAFLNNVTNSLVRAWTQTVHGFWTQLIRGTNDSILCSGGSNCESSLIPLNHTFVVPGGRFREQYYWDSFWIVEGLLESELFDIANDTLQNFMDELDSFGFIPNGGRIYYLDRSQPPLFIQMLFRYVNVTGDRSILTRALPLAEKELKWWHDNRSLNVTSPFTNRTHLVYHYNVNNSAPRPESYLTDYLTANGPDVSPSLNDTQKADLYAELATGAESGWDYTRRWFTDGDNDGSLRNLGVRSLIGVDLNSILYRDHVALADLYGSSNGSQVKAHRDAASALRTAVLDLLWDGDKLAFYDFNLATNQRKSFFSVVNFYPLWSGIIPDVLLSDANAAFGHFASLNLVMNRYNGTFPTTFVDTGLQWDAPNTWAPHQYIVLQALRALPSNITSGALPTTGSGNSTYSLIPAGQLALAENQLPQQPKLNPADGNFTSTGPGADANALNGTVFNGGNATDGEGWGQILQRELANRYITSAFCSWRATGGSIPGVSPRLSDPELNVTQSVNNTGNMFEKFSAFDLDSAGRGGEYTVQAGFGWTNGVVLWIASNYGQQLNAPQCPSLLVAAGSSTSSARGPNTIPIFWTMTIMAFVVALL
ncbi:glycoside hydrolase family 37 protein [Macrolepiota fuliginosa MF-IS2]|uniref:Trehalase n=1 Tax=Macrolepiota fuliginosa MF-IS2 TaxID=1400762 RepID=A0A9P5XFM9_9AGAR|nr:glycoside hydrolase family 37 protein [Macrolepiota fuliginosa MF-IS2]